MSERLVDQLEIVVVKESRDFVDVNQTRAPGQMLPELKEDGEVAGRQCGPSLYTSMPPEKSSLASIIILVNFVGTIAGVQ